MSIEELKKWLKKKEVRTWKRILLLLCETGESLPGRDIASAVGIHRPSAWRTLKILQIHSQVKPEMKKNTMYWHITPRGRKDVRRWQETGFLPRRD